MSKQTTEKPKVIHTTHTLQFKVPADTDVHNELGIVDHEFFTDQFVVTATAGRYHTARELFAQITPSLDALAQQATTYPDFESLKMAAFADYLQQFAKK